MTIPTKADFRIDEKHDAARVEVVSGIDPLSLQAKPHRKREFQDALGEAVKEATVGVYTHDVEATLTWFIQENRRYQTHLVADLDNVLKPILDALTGPGKVLIDDNQIQSIRASWMTPRNLETGFQLTLEALHIDDYVVRDNVCFVEFSPDRCYIMPLGPDGGHAPLLVSGYRMLLSAHREAMSLGQPEEQAAGLLPLARPFPRARLRGFKVFHESEFPEPT